MTTSFKTYPTKDTATKNFLFAEDFEKDNGKIVKRFLSCPLTSGNELCDELMTNNKHYYGDCSRSEISTASHLFGRDPSQGVLRILESHDSGPTGSEQLVYGRIDSTRARSRRAAVGTG